MSIFTQSLQLLRLIFLDFSGELMWGREVAVDDVAVITGFAIFLCFPLFLWGLNKTNSVSRHVCVS